jgi:hypothetical protein
LIVIFNGMSILRNAKNEDIKQNKISHEVGIKFAEEEKEKQKLLAERQQVQSLHANSHGHSHSLEEKPSASSCCAGGTCSSKTAVGPANK